MKPATWRRSLVCAALLVFLMVSMTSCSSGTQAPETDEKLPIKIGVLADLTGPSAQYGEGSICAAQMVEEDVNSIGGISGRELQIVIEDHQSRPEAGIDAIHKLIDVDNVDGIVHGVASGVFLAVAEYAQEQGVPIINTGASSPQIAEVGDYAFSVMGLDTVMGKGLANLAWDMGYREVGFLVMNNPFGLGIEEAASQEFEVLGGTVPVKVEYTSAQLDYRADVARLADVDAVISVAYGEEAAVILKQAFEAGIKPQWLWAYISDLGVSEPETTEGIIGFDIGLGTDAEYFKEQYAARCPGMLVAPYQPALWDGLWTMVMAMGLADSDRAATRDAIHIVGPQVRAATGLIEFDENGMRKWMPYTLLRVTGGEPIPLDEIPTR